MLTDREIHTGIHRIVAGKTLEELKELGIHASVGYKRPKARTHWVELPYPSPEGFLWVGMPKGQMERCVILGGLPRKPKPTLASILKTIAKVAAYAYVGFGDYWHVKTEGERVTLHDFTSTSIRGSDGNLVFSETKTNRRPINIPGRTRIALLDKPEIAFKIPGVREITLFDHRHKAIPNPYKAGKSEYH